MQATDRFFYTLLGFYALLCAVLAINPIDRPTWFVENLTVWVIIAVIFGFRHAGVRFSNLAYALMFVLIYSTKMPHGVSLGM